jgi:hypothetical protein
MGGPFGGSNRSTRGNVRFESATHARHPEDPDRGTSLRPAGPGFGASAAVFRGIQVGLGVELMAEVPRVPPSAIVMLDCTPEGRSERVPARVWELLLEFPSVAMVAALDVPSVAPDLVGQLLSRGVADVLDLSVEDGGRRGCLHSPPVRCAGSRSGRTPARTLAAPPRWRSRGGGRARTSSRRRSPYPHRSAVARSLPTAFPSRRRGRRT